jgi:hypothetical protein
MHEIYIIHVYIFWQLHYLSPSEVVTFMVNLLPYGHGG